MEAGRLFVYRLLDWAATAVDSVLSPLCGEAETFVLFYHVFRKIAPNRLKDLFWGSNEANNISTLVAAGSSARSCSLCLLCGLRTWRKSN